MTPEQKSELKRRLWENTARRRRRELSGQIRLLAPRFIANFASEQESQRLGRLFWQRVGTITDNVVSGFASCKEVLRPCCWDVCEVVYFHRYCDECGVLLCDLALLLEHADSFREQLGPDFLFMEPGASLGFCFEEDEYECYLRVWGMEGGPHSTAVVV